MAHILPKLVFLVALIAAHETMARSLKQKGSSKTSVRKPLALVRKLFALQQSRQATADACSAGGLSLTASTDVQSFSMGHYDNNMDCTWTITADDDMVVYVHVTSYDIEDASYCGYDFLSVAGENLCGQGSYEAYSDGNTITIHFHSDYSVTNSGFDVEFSQISADQVPDHITAENACDGGLGVTATSDVQTFSLQQYDNYMDCTWTITAEEGMAVYVYIGNYAIENAYSCQYDYLSVAEGDGSDVRLCGEGSFEGFSVGTAMTLHFHSDCSVTHNGFTVEYSQIPESGVPAQLAMDDGSSTMPGASGSVIALDVVNNTETVLTSHSGSSNYANNLNSTTTVTAPQGMLVRLAVQAFDVEYACNCQYDWVSVYNSAGALLQTWCGAVANGQETISMDNMTIWLHTDGSVTGTGFIFELSVMDPSSLASHQLPGYAADSCPGPMEVLSSSEAEQIASPNYGIAQYTNGMSCSWLITAPEGQYVAVSFISLDIEQEQSCTWDSLSFYDGPATSNLVAKICGTIAPEYFTSSGTELLIEFRTDSSVTGDGFLIEVSAASELSRPSDACGVFRPQTVTTNGTVISSSTGNDGLYLASSHCSWLLQAPEASQTVTFTFTNFHLEDSSQCMYDSLAFYNSHSANSSSLIGGYCGSTSPITVTSSGSALLMEFLTDYCIQYEGFSGVVTFGTNEPTEPVGFGDGTYDSTPIWGSEMSPPDMDYPEPILEPFTGECGVPAIESESTFERIVGGDEATANSWPWQISLRWCPGCGAGETGSHICGGVVLSESWVITAAHCVVDSLDQANSGSDYKIVAGDHDRSVYEGHEQTRDITEIIVNPYYSIVGDRDAALLHLASPLTLNDYVSPICLTDTPAPVETNCVATGWGETESDAESNLVLREVTLPVLSQGFCAEAYGSYITPYTICAGYEEGGRDTCQGDSGGPLVCKIDGAWQLHGLTSFGYGCAEVGYPGVYTRVSEIITWVQGYTNNQIHLLSSLNATTDVSGSGTTTQTTVVPVVSASESTASPVVVEVAKRPPGVGKMVNWNVAGTEKEVTENSQLAAWKRKLADLTQKGAENSKKLVEFLKEGDLGVEPRPLV